jgi:hypothetical protein
LFIREFHGSTLSTSAARGMTSNICSEKANGESEFGETCVDGPGKAAVIVKTLAQRARLRTGRRWVR